MCGLIWPSLCTCRTYIPSTMMRVVVFGCAMMQMIHCGVSLAPVPVYHQCNPGFYPTDDANKTCLPCTRCPIGGIEITPCINGKDTKCTCREGHFVKKDYCRKCHKCKAGTGVVQQCGGENNTVCQACGPGSFSSDKSLSSVCRPCLRCKRHEELIRTCTSRRNSVCGDCKKGYFRSTYLNQCWKCSYCFPGYPNITDTVRECQTQNLKPEYTCMPLERPPYGFVPLSDRVTEPGLSTPNISRSTPNSERTRLATIIVCVVVTLVLVIIMAVVILIAKKTSENHKAIEPKESHVNTLTFLGGTDNPKAKDPVDRLHFAQVGHKNVSKTRIPSQFQGPELNSTCSEPLLFKSCWVEDTVCRPSSAYQPVPGTWTNSNNRTVRCPLRDLDVQGKHWSVISLVR